MALGPLMSMMLSWYALIETLLTHMQRLFEYTELPGKFCNGW